MTMQLTQHQRDLLVALRGLRGQWASMPVILGRQPYARQHDQHSPQGVHQTAASLRRRKLIESSRWRGHVYYRLLPAGNAALSGRR